jgi:ribosomal subunit interface protein
MERQAGLNLPLLEENPLMQIQINSDKNISLHNKLSSFVESELHRTLNRFDSHITRIEVHLSDENGSKPGLKTGPQDKRCKLEARPRGLAPIVATGAAPNMQQSVSGAALKLKRQLEATFSRLADRRIQAAVEFEPTA